MSRDRPSARTQLARPAAPATRSSPAPAVVRTAALLGELAAADGPLGLSDLARRLGVAKSSLSNICAALEDAALIRRVDAGYTLGHRLVELAGAYLRKVDLVSEFHAAARSLPAAAEETVLLGLLDGSDVLYLARHDGSQPIRLASDVGRRMPAVCTALGKAMLSTLTDDEVTTRLDRLDRFPVLTPKGAQNAEQLLDDLRRTRARGYAVDDEENTEGVCCLSVALPGGAWPPHAVSVTLLKARTSERLRERLVADLHRLANSLPHRLDRP